MCVFVCVCAFVRDWVLLCACVCKCVGVWCVFMLVMGGTENCFAGI